MQLNVIEHDFQQDHAKRKQKGKSSSISQSNGDEKTQNNREIVYAKKYHYSTTELTRTMQNGK